MINSPSTSLVFNESANQSLSLRASFFINENGKYVIYHKFEIMR